MEMPKHVAISLDDASEWRRKNNVGINEGHAKYFDLLNKLLETQVRAKIPVFTVYLLPENAEKSSEDYLIFSEHMSGFFGTLCDSAIIKEQKIKISVFGKWYNLPGKLVESLKKAIEDTKEYDGFFLNFCINYGGQEEIVDACRLLAKQVELGKIDPEMITKEAIKENIYSSYFLPPDLILIYGYKKLSGLLLWDSVNSRVEFANKPFMEFEEGDLDSYL